MIARNRYASLGRCLLAAVLAAGTACSLGEQAQARSSVNVGTLKVLHLKKSGRVVLHWKGKIDRPMAKSFQNAIARWQGHARNGFIVSLDSKGGRVHTAYKVIQLLRRLRRSHLVHTYVRRGNVCGSSCVPIFLQGEKRTAALASQWLFHEISSRDKKAKGQLILKPGRTAKMFQDFFLPAGVPPAWIDNMRNQIRGADLWMTGAQLRTSGSNIANHFLSNQKIRKNVSRVVW